MDAKWIAEERRLWDQFMAWPRLTSDTRRGARLIHKAKERGKPAPKYPSTDEAAARSWGAYRAWISH